MPPGLNSEHTPENCFTLFQTSHPAPPRIPAPRIALARPHIGPVLGQT